MRYEIAGWWKFNADTDSLDRLYKVPGEKKRHETSKTIPEDGILIQEGLPLCTDGTFIERYLCFSVFPNNNLDENTLFFSKYKNGPEGKTFAMFFSSEFTHPLQA